MLFLCSLLYTQHCYKQLLTPGRERKYKPEEADLQRRGGTREHSSDTIISQSRRNLDVTCASCGGYKVRCLHSLAAARYKSGWIYATRAVVNPARPPNVTGSQANELVVIKDDADQSSDTRIARARAGKMVNSRFSFPLLFFSSTSKASVTTKQKAKVATHTHTQGRDLVRDVLSLRKLC